jgi:putative hemolysin
MEKFRIELEPIVRTSKNKFIRNLPPWIIRFIERTIKADELNRLIETYGHLQGMDFIRALLFDEFKVKVHYLGNKDFDPNKRYVYVANHPLGGIDAMAHLNLVYERHGNVKSPSNELFNYVPNLRPLILGVNVFGRNSKSKALELNELFASDYQIMMFPAGEVSRLINWEIKDPPWKKTFVSKAVEHKRDIIPSFISGHNSFWFYFWAKLRKISGIKLYIETMLLPREMFKCYNMEIYFWTLEPISYQEIEQSGKDFNWWTQEIYNRVYQAKKQLKDYLKLHHKTH